MHISSTIKINSKIWIDFEGRHPFIYQIDKNGYNTTLIDGTHPLPASINGCFINHQFLFHFFNFRNSQSINLFPVFIKDILSFCKDEKSGLHIGEMYDEITTSIVKRGKRIDPTYISNIEYFNKAVKEVVENINIYASDIYNKHFRDDDNLELQIRLRYDSNLDKPTDDPNEYWLKYDKVIEYTKENGILKEHLSSYKKLNKPFIGLEISERQSDGSFRKITKPHTYFNEAKLTAIALSVRFALLNLEKPADGRFLALDDMLISLDMSNRAKVVAFLLSISDKYKIYLFTHDKMFFEYFKHKTRCSKQEWVYKEIYMDDSKAPYLRNSNDYLGQAEHFIKQHEYEIAGNFCRKAAESICKKFLPRKWQLSLDYTLLDLNGLIQNCKTFASESGVKDLSVFEKLDEYRKFILNPSSHDNYDVVKYRYEVENCLEALHSFDSIEVKPFMEYGAKVYFELKEPIPSINVYKFEISLCDDFRVIKQNGQEPIISKGMINYRVIKNGVIGDRKTDNTTLRHFYDVNYNRSDKSGNSNFLEGIFDAKSNNSINMML